MRLKKLSNLKHSGCSWRQSVFAAQTWGTPEDKDCIVVVGRSNYRKSSASIETLLADLHAAGFVVVWFESRMTEIARWRDARLERLLGGRLLPWCQSHGTLGKHVRRLANALILMMRPDKWSYLSTRFNDPNVLSARDLRHFLHQWPLRSVHLFAHSAGGIVSSLVAEEPAIASMVCFGYPFKHPEKDEESVRTAHLPAVCKPFLIFQGDQDEYGTALDAQRYPLSASTVVKSIHSNHDYDSLASQEYCRCLALLLRFLRGVVSAKRDDVDVSEPIHPCSQFHRMRLKAIELPQVAECQSRDTNSRMSCH